MDPVEIPDEPIDQVMPDDRRYARSDNVGKLIALAVETMTAMQSDDSSGVQQKYGDFIIEWCHIAPDGIPALPLVVLAAMVQHVARESGTPHPSTHAVIADMQRRWRHDPADGNFVRYTRIKLGWFYACALGD